MANVLLLFVHPLLEKSRIHARLIKAAQEVRGITIHDLYQQYPDFDVDIRREQDLLGRHDLIIWQHPFYWYSAPPLLRQWQDLVLEHGWAYGRNGTALEGKKLMQVLSTGGGRDAYADGGFNRFPLRDYLRPFERTVELCHMQYYPPYWVDGVHRINDREIDQHARQYKELLTALRDESLPEDDLQSASYMNEILPQHQTSS